MGSWGAASTFHFDMMPGDRQGDGDGGQTLGGGEEGKDLRSRYAKGFYSSRLIDASTSPQLLQTLDGG